ncbi:HV01 protein, partial [Tricholaema leucomelas]|nr:HV01 protein [Tricholaema leucomelas]NXX52025.1 HV01 protein [Tricholaema leucomelas]
GVWAQLRLAEAGGGLRVSGDKATLLCRGHGFAFGGHGVRWYRQTASGRLQWLSYINLSGTIKKYAAAVEGRAMVSRDNSQSESSLSLWALHHWDSAHYFCTVSLG